jgi:hypothetical protein
VTGRSIGVSRGADSRRSFCSRGRTKRVSPSNTGARSRSKAASVSRRPQYSEKREATMRRDWSIALKVTAPCSSSTAASRSTSGRRAGALQ